MTTITKGIHRNGLADSKPAPDITWLIAPAKGTEALFKDAHKCYSMVSLITPIHGDDGPSIAELTGGDV